MRLLILIPMYSRGGTEEYALTIASAAMKQGWDVHAAFPNTEKTRSLVHDVLARGICYHPAQLYSSGHSGLWRTALECFRVIRLIMAVKPDSIQINLTWPILCRGSILACGFLKTPTVVIFHLIPHIFPLRYAVLKAYEWARTRNQRWIAVSEYNRKQVCATFQLAQSDVQCIHNGTKLDIRDFEHDPNHVATSHQKICQELGLSPSSRLIVTVGRLHPQKGYADIVPIIPHLVKEFADLKFLWIGDGELRDDLRCRVQEYGAEKHVIFLGYRSDVPEFLDGGDLFLFPTHFEGLPLTLLEAMAHGLPIVASNATSIPEVIEHQVNGLLFRTGDSCDLLEAVRWALRHPKEMKQMGRNARERVREFSEEQMTQHTLKMLETLTATHRG